MKNNNEKKVRIFIQDKHETAEKDAPQYTHFQKDGVTIEVPIGKLVEVPLWVAESAIRCGDIKEYIED